MANLFDGLFVYEIILMILGTILFSLVLFLIFKNKEITRNHLAGLGLGIVMIGFPSIKSFSISDGIINIERDLEELKENPEDMKTKKQLEEDLSDLGERPINDPERLSTLSEANLELGKEEKAKSLAKEALSKSPKNLQAKEVVNVIETEEKIKAVQKNPKDSVAKKQLHEKITTLKKIPTESGRRTSQIARGYELLGDEEMARAYVDSTKMYQPKHPILKRYDRKEPLVPDED